MCIVCICEYMHVLYMCVGIHVDACHMDVEGQGGRQETPSIGLPCYSMRQSLSVKPRAPDMVSLEHQLGLGLLCLHLLRLGLPVGHLHPLDTYVGFQRA